MLAHTVGLRLSLALAPVLVLGCAGSGTPAPQTDRAPVQAAAPAGEGGAPRAEREPVDHRREEEGESAEEAANNAAMEKALERAVEGRGAAWDDLHLLAECTTDGGFRQVEVFGDGVTIWNRGRQYTLDEKRVAGLLETIDRADFAEMDELYGQEELDAVMRIICRVVLTVDGVTKQVGQLAEGPQNEKLKGLSRTILHDAFEPPEVGVTADDLDDGLAKIADGRLAPQALHVILNRKPDDFALSRGEPGYILRIDGRKASVQRLSAKGGYAASTERTLSDEEMAKLTSLLAEQQVGTLPANLYAVHYTDLVIEVLDRSQRIQARQFANTTRSTHGEAQVRYDRAFDGLSALALGILGNPG